MGGRLYEGQGVCVGGGGCMRDRVCVGGRLYEGQGVCGGEAV